MTDATLPIRGEYYTCSLPPLPRFKSPPEGEPWVLIYDIETAPIELLAWSTGEQFLGHNNLAEDHYQECEKCKHPNLIKARRQYDIICLSYMWAHEGVVRTLDWGYEEQDCRPLILQFDKVAELADVIVGKNSNKFDNKMLNSIRMFKNLPPAPDWAISKDDVEVQMRGAFRSLSQSLDYYSRELNLGGKHKVDFSTWVYIIYKHPVHGLKAFKEMIFYNRKDVVDTEKLRLIIKPYLEKLKINMNMYTKLIGKEKYGYNVCRHCGSPEIHFKSERVSGLTRYKQFWCTTHKGYAGQAPIAKNGGIGRIR